MEALEEGKIQGKFLTIGVQDKHGLLEAIVNKNLIYPAEFTSQREEIWTYGLLEIKESEYQRFKEKGSIETHEGFRHISLRDTTREESLSSFERFNYESLKNSVNEQ